jgi:hypothetical protein
VSNFYAYISSFTPQNDTSVQIGITTSAEGIYAIELSAIVLCLQYHIGPLNLAGRFSSVNEGTFRSDTVLPNFDLSSTNYGYVADSSFCFLGLNLFQMKFSTTNNLQTKLVFGYTGQSVTSCDFSNINQIVLKAACLALCPLGTY